DWPRATVRLEELNALVEDPDLWNNPGQAQKLMRERTRLAEAVEGCLALESRLADTTEIIELAEADDDDDLAEDGLKDLRALQEQAQVLHLQALLSGEADANDAYVEIHAGAGGTESQDW